MHRRRLCFLFGILLFAALAFLLLNWNDAAVPGKALPPPFDEWGAPGVPMNAAIYIAPQRPSAVSIRAQDGRESGVRVVRFEGVAIDPVHEYAARAEFADAEDVSEAAAALQADIWARTHGNALWFGKPDNAWADTVRAAWAEEDRVPWAEYEPVPWRGWLLLPDEPPSPLLGLGFIRNREDLLDRTLRELGVEAEGFGFALRLARMNLASFGLYGDFGDAPPEINSDVLHGTGAGIIVVAESSYPAFLVGALWGRVASAARLEAITLDGEGAHYRSLEDEWHMTAKRYGRTMYLAVAPSRGGSEELVQTVIDSQRRRRSPRLIARSFRSSLLLRHGSELGEALFERGPDGVVLGVDVGTGEHGGLRVVPIVGAQRDLAEERQ